MRSAFAWLILVLALFAPQFAFAATWIKFHEGAEGAYYFDKESPRTKGDWVYAVSKFIPQRPFVERRLQKTVYAELTTHIFNCRDQSYATAGVVAYGDAGQVIGSASLPYEKLQFTKAPPGSLLDELSGRVCTIARERAALKPQVLAGSIFAGDWRAASSTGANGEIVFYRPDSIRWLSTNMFTFIMRADFPSGLSVTPEFPKAYHVVSLTTVDCSRETYVASVVDAYGQNSELLTSGPTHSADSPIKSGSSVATIEKSMCSARGVRAAEAPPPSPGAPAQPGSDSGAPEATEPALAMGTGWLTSKGYLVTAAHVVAGAKSITVMQDGKVVGVAEVAVSDPANDVAVLKPRLKGGLHPAIPLAAAPAVLGESIFTLGYPAPDRMGLSLKLTTGTVNATSGTDDRHETVDDARLIQFSAPVQGGNSGGPVIDGRGRAVGIVVTKASLMNEHEIAENVNYALKVRYVNALLSELPDLGGWRPSIPAKGADLPTLAKELRGAVFLLVVEQDAEDEQQASKSDQR